jgi:FecR protein
MNYTYYRRYQPSRRKNSSFKSFFWLVVFLVVALLVLRACVSLAAALLEEKKDEAVLTVYKGDAEILEWGQTEAEKASDAQLILEGDQVQTQSDSWAILTFYNGTTIKLDQNTKVVLSKVETDQEKERAYLELLEGRLWVDHSLEDESLDLQIDTTLMTIQSVQGQYLVSQLEVGETVYVNEGPVTVEFMDRSDEGSVIETIVLKENEMSLLDPDKRTALLARENVTLVEAVGEGMFTDSFVKWCEGVPMEGTEPEDIPEEETPVEEVPEETAEPVNTFTIRIDSPTTGSTISKDAIALEGSIVSGTASKVTVTWSGSGVPYTLSGFQPGGSTFRYVADVDYGNYARGQNTYTITAYDEAGNPSNTVTVVLNAEF